MYVTTYVVTALKFKLEWLFVFLFFENITWHIYVIIDYYIFVFLCKPVAVATSAITVHIHKCGYGICTCMYVASESF